MTSGIEITSLIGPLENVTDQGTGQLVIRGAAVGRWGLDQDSDGYYDSAGADDGEHALLAIDAAGNPSLTQALTPGRLTDRPEGPHFASTRAVPQRAYHRDDTGRLFGGPRLVEQLTPARRDDGTLFGGPRLIESAPMQRRADGRVFGRGELEPKSSRSYNRGRDGRLFARVTQS